MPTPDNPALATLKTRADFLRVAQGRKAHKTGLLLQMRARALDQDPAIGVGITVSRKVGNAVSRNRAKRRLRAVARLVLVKAGKPGHDYVLVGRRETVDRPFRLLEADLVAALMQVHGAPSRPRTASAADAAEKGGT